MIRVRKKFISACRDRERRDALALAIVLKSRLGRKSVIRDFTVNRVSVVTGVSARVVGRLLPLMIRYGYCETVGPGGRHLSTRKLHSGRNGLNCRVPAMDPSMKYTDVRRMLLTFGLLLLQSGKEYVRKIAGMRKDPGSYEEYRDTRRKITALSRKGTIKSTRPEYSEHGMSYRRIAERLGISVRSAFSIVRNARNLGLIVWKKVCEQICVPGICRRRDPERFTFSTMNNIYIVGANIYSLTDISRRLL